MSPNTLLGIVIALLITMGVPALIIYLIHRFSRVPVSVPLYGALFCLISTAITVPLGAYVWPLVFGSRAATGTLVATAISVGVCEELARFASFRFVKTMREHRDHAGAMAAGLGHAAVGSVLVGMQIASGVMIMMMLPNKFTVPELEQTLVHGGPQVVLEGLRQLPLIACSLAFSILIVLAWRRSRIFLAVAIVAHVSVLLLSSLLPYLWGLAVLSLCGGLALVFVALVVRSRIIAPDHPPESDDAGARLDPARRP